MSITVVFSATIIFLTYSLLYNKHTLWTIKENNIVYSSKTSFDHQYIYINSLLGLRCYNIKDGSLKWSNKEMHSIYSPTIYKNEIITGSTDTEKLYRIDAKTGKLIKSYIINKTVVLTRLAKNNLVYLISEKNENSYLQVYNPSNQSIETIYSFKGNIRGPLLMYNESILIQVEVDYPDGMLYCINLLDRNQKWKKDIYVEGDLLSQHIAQYKDSIYFVDIPKKTLTCIDIKSGKINGTILLPDIRSSKILINDGRLLIHGKKLYLYNIASKCLEVISNEHNDFFAFNNNGIIYDNKNKLYLYDNKLNRSKEIYSFRGKERYLFFLDKNYLLLILSDNVREALAGNKPFIYKLLNL